MPVHAHEHGSRELSSLTGWAWLSVGAAVTTIALKSAAYAITGSVGLLSDAAESVVNLVAAVVALMALRVASRPPDASHPYGHGKAEYVSAAVEGLMILVAAGLIIYSAVDRLLDPRPLEEVGIGLIITVVATAINAVVGVLLLRVGRRHGSIALTADGKHLLTDVWTSAGVIIGVAVVGLTGWLPLDSIVALAVALNILWTGGVIVRRSLDGLMDHALSADEVEAIQRTVDAVLVCEPEAEVHELLTRSGGRQRFVSMHVRVPGAWSVSRGHELLDRIEHALVDTFPGTTVHTHLEPVGAHADTA